jgi:outer membrane protein insertion porin family
VGGTVFADFASDLGSGDTVLGEPASVRGKPGNGFGYGVGVRLDSPIGLIRADFGINDQGYSRLQLGIGQRF